MDGVEELRLVEKQSYETARDRDALYNFLPQAGLKPVKDKVDVYFPDAKARNGWTVFVEYDVAANVFSPEALNYLADKTASRIKTVIPGANVNIDACEIRGDTMKFGKIYVDQIIGSVATEYETDDDFLLTIAKEQSELAMLQQKLADCIGLGEFWRSLGKDEIDVKDLRSGTKTVRTDMKRRSIIRIYPCEELAKKGEYEVSTDELKKYMRPEEMKKKLDKIASKVPRSYLEDRGI